MSDSNSPSQGSERANFYFRCQRSGNCCRVGTGRVWVTSAEVAAMASAKGMTADAFIHRFVVRVRDRFSLMEEANGACVLLDGAAECSVYEHRPQQCRDFPQWSCFDADPRAWQRATEYCPGIHQVPSYEAWTQAVPRLRALLRQLGNEFSEELEPPCLSERGHCEASSMEVDYLLALLADPAVELPKLEDGELARCPALVGGKCLAGEHRPLVCRKLPASAHQAARLTLQHLADELNYPWSRGEWLSLIRDRAAAWRLIADKLPTV